MTDDAPMTIDVHPHAIPDCQRDAPLAAGRAPSLSGFPAWTAQLALKTTALFQIAKATLSASTTGLHWEYVTRREFSCGRSCLAVLAQHDRCHSASRAVIGTARGVRALGNV